MEKLVNRVTVLEGSGPTREAKVVYDGHEEEFPTIPIDSSVRSVTVVEGGHPKVIFRSRYWADHDGSSQEAERGFRRFLKADMIRAQDAYRRHLESAGDHKQNWWLDLPANMVRSFIKAGRKVEREERAEERGADLKDDMRDLKDDFKATAVDLKRDVKSKASDTKTKVKGI